MVFQKQSRKDFQTRFRKGFKSPNKGRTIGRSTEKVSLRPFLRLSKDRHQLIAAEGSNPTVKLLRPKPSDKPEVQISAESKPNIR